MEGWKSIKMTKNNNHEQDCAEMSYFADPINDLIDPSANCDNTKDHVCAQKCKLSANLIQSTD